MFNIINSILQQQDITPSYVKYKILRKITKMCGIFPNQPNSLYYVKRIDIKIDNKFLTYATVTNIGIFNC